MIKVYFIDVTYSFDFYSSFINATQVQSQYHPLTGTYIVTQRPCSAFCLLVTSQFPYSHFQILTATFQTTLYQQYPTVLYFLLQSFISFWHLFLDSYVQAVNYLSEHVNFYIYRFLIITQSSNSFIQVFKLFCTCSALTIKAFWLI